MLLKGEFARDLTYGS